MSTSQQDTRWEQRLDNYSKALEKLSEGLLQLSNEDNFCDETQSLLVEGIIQRFEFTHELAWKLLKDYANYQGSNLIMGSRDATRYALRVGLIDDERWMQMIQSRNITSHYYDENQSMEVFQEVKNHYHPLLIKLEATMKELQTEA